MENTKPFYDLCIHSKLAVNFNAFANKCVEFGYKTIAINHVIDVSNTDSTGERKKKMKKDNQSCFVYPPLQISAPKDLDLTILNRLTLICDSKDVLNNIIHHQNFYKYHIFAINAKNSELFHTACDCSDVDIITFDPLDIKGFKISRKIYKKAVSRGIYFEIMYCPAIIDNTLRKNIITRSHMYHQKGRSENIIITSGCTSVLTLRGPYDVINLGLILGLNEQQSKRSITSAGADVIQHAMSRKIGKAIVYISTTMETDNDGDETNELVGPIQKKLKTNENDVILLDS